VPPPSPPPVRHIYVGGGSSLTSVEQYDIETDTHVEITPMQSVRQYHAMAYIGNHLYAVGGTSSSQTMERLDLSDPTGNSWAYVTGPNGNRNNVAGSVLHGLFYIAGSCDTSWYWTAEVYDPSADAWTALPNMPSYHSCYHEAATLDGKFYVLGGYTSDSNRRASRYDPSTQLWTQITNMNNGHENFAASEGGGYIYVTGGWNSYMERYDPTDGALGSWTNMANTPSSIGTGGNSMLFLHGLLYSFGSGSGCCGSSVSVYDPDAASWTSKAAMSHNRYNGDSVPALEM